MKYLRVFVWLLFPLYNFAQVPEQKLSKDSFRYYRREVYELQKKTYDSLVNSERYKYLADRLNRNRRVMRVELLVNLGLYFNDFENLNVRLKSLGQKELKPMSPSAGITLAFGFPTMTYGFDLSTYAFDNSTASFKGAHARVFIGAHLLKKSPIVLNPQIGYAGSMMNLIIHRPAGSNNFNDLFTAQSNSAQISHINDYLDFTLGFKAKGAKRENFFWQFLRVGYRYGLKEKAWSKRGGGFVDAPKDRNNQFFIQFCFGFDHD
jgi:hypothetical protein